MAIVKDDLPPAGPQRQAPLPAARARARDEAGRHPGDRRQPGRWRRPATRRPRSRSTSAPTRSTYLAERTREFPGVLTQQVYLRDYPHGQVGAAVLGQIGQITGPSPTSHGELGTHRFKGIQQGTYVGQAGLEAEYQPYLQGKTGVERIQVNAAGFPTGRTPKVTRADARATS